MKKDDVVFSSELVREVRFAGELIFDTNLEKYLDQLSEEAVYVDPRQFPRYLKVNYGLTCEEYYNLVMFNDRFAKHICPICGKRELTFGTLQRPYKLKCDRCSQHVPADVDKLYQDFLEYVKLPDSTTIDNADKMRKLRISIITSRDSYSSLVDKTLLTELKKTKCITRTFVQEACNNERLNYRYLNRTNVVEYLKSRGFHDYEIQFILKM